MPKVLSRKTSHVKSAFSVYDGDDPRPGVYRGVVKQLALQKASTGAIMVYHVIELLAKDGSNKAQYDGYAAIGRIVFGDSDMQQEREQALFRAIAGKDDVDIAYDSAFDKFKDGDKQRAKIEKIGGVNPIGKIVLVRITSNDNPDYSGMQTDGIYPARNEDGNGTADVPQDPDEDIDVDVDDEDGDEEIEDYTEEELTAKSLAALRTILVDEFEMDAKEAALLKQKAKLVSAILEAQSALDEDEDEEEDEEVEEEELDEDEDEEEEDEDDPEVAIRAELAELDRAGLKARLKKLAPAAKVTTKMTDDDIRELIVPLANVPF